jgi:2-oxoglutarate dehydrogenase E2 component (dihydrolipoamide succinyltransferase)
MKTEVLIPEIGESVTEGIIAAWLKSEGAEVQEGEDLFELETDKATLAVPSPAKGVLSIIAQEGEEVAVGQTVASIEADKAPVRQEEGDASSTTKTGSEQTGKETDRQAVEFEITIDEHIPETDTAQPTAALARASEKKSGQRAVPLSPAVRRLVEEHHLDPGEIDGSGKDGRLTKGDVLHYIEKMKAEQGGGGSLDKVTVEQAQAAPAAEKRESPVSPSQISSPVSRPGAAQRREKMTTIRRRIAENLLQVKQGAAHVTTFNEIDMHAVTVLRRSYREAFEKRHGVRLGFMSFFVKACCAALDAYPLVNAWIDGDDIVYNDEYNIGIAVSTERGLLVPVLRNADRLGFGDIERAIRDFAERAREKKITVDELTGGTFSITNGGVFGSMLSTPIPSPPQSAILGMHAIRERPVVVEGEVAIRPVMYVALTYDHRLIDGREAVRFLVRVKECIEDPQRLLIDI